MLKFKDYINSFFKAIKNFFINIGHWLKKRTSDNKKNYLSIKEIKNISKQNLKLTRSYEKAKNKKVKQEEYITEMSDSNNIIEISNLKTYFFTDVGTVKAVDGVSFNIPKESTVGVVGESGCGKSVTSLSIMKLVQGPQGQIVDGEIRYDSSDGNCYNIVKMPLNEMRKVRGKEIGMIFQEPMTSLNPVFTIGMQLDEVSVLHNKDISKAEVKKKSIDMLKLVGIARPKGVYKNFPHELSGGMRQRVMIAMALACNPRLIIADEPTTALDVTIQAQILDILRNLKDKFKSSIMLITHDLGVIAEMADYVVVMYAGKVVEKGTVTEIFDNPLHPYTVGLQKSKPSLNQESKRLYSIPGQVPNPINMPNHCYFKDRCTKCIEKCNGEQPPLFKLSDTHSVACYLYEKDFLEEA